MVDSPLAAKFVAAPDHWSRNGAAPRAIVIHMAEGGGTVSWLTRNDGNSSHYVVEYTGRIVQMVDEDRAAGSMNPRMTRTDDDRPFLCDGVRVVYGRSALNSAGIASDPNRYAIAIEVEGFAAEGPNSKQRVALSRLVADIRRRRGALPCLGHRDQQDYKACPGKKIPWGDYGGHAVKAKPDPIPPMPDTSTGESVKSFSVPEQPTVVKIKDLAWLYTDSSLAANAGNIRLSPSRELGYVGSFSDAVKIVAYEPVQPDEGIGSAAMFVRAEDIVSRRILSGFDADDLEAARKAGFADAKKKALSAVGGITA